MKETITMLTLFYIFLALLGLISAAPKVTKITPKVVGTGGGMRLTVHGKGFANEFNYGTNNAGNEVLLKSLTSVVQCKVVKIDTTRKQIVCYPPQRGLEENRRYCVRVRVNGNWIPNRRLCNGYISGDDCCFLAKWIFTPTVDTLEPTSLIPAPDMKIRMCGRIFTSRYGTDKATAENGRTETILRIYAPGQCELKNLTDTSEDNYYELYVEETSDEGCMVCSPKSSFIGNANVTYYVDEALGRSVPKGDLLKVSWDGIIHMLQYYPVISSVSINNGSRLGGLVLRVYSPNAELGGGLGSTYEPSRIFIGETECQITDCVKNSHFDCVVAPEPSLDNRPDTYAGGRGADVEFWDDGTFENFDAIYNADKTSDIVHFDETRFCNHAINEKQTRLTGLFYARESGVYQFEVRATYRAKLYFEDIAQGESWGGWSTGDNWELEEEEMYKITVVAMGPSSNPSAAAAANPCVEVRAKFFDEEKFTYLWTGLSVPEVQILRLTSIQRQDVQVLNFTQGPLQEPVHEVQKVCREYDSSAMARIGMFGSLTGEVNLDDISAVKRAVNELPFLGPDEFFEVEQHPVNPLCIQVTFHSNRGNFPNLEVIAEAAIVTEVTTGVPDNDIVSLMIGDRPSIPFSLASLNLTAATKMQEVVDSMFVTSCPDRFRTRSVYFESFEEPAAHYYTGRIVNNIEAFCGRQSIRNPWRLFPNNRVNVGPISLRTHSAFHACFAYSRISNPRLVFLYTDTNGYGRWHSINAVSYQASVVGNFWQYTCVSLKEVVQDGELVDVRLHGLYDEEFFVDAINFGPEAVFTAPAADSGGYYINEMRLRPASPRPEMNVLIDHADVTFDEGIGYTVTLFPLHCGFNFDLFGLLNSEEKLTGDSDLGLTELRGGATEMDVKRTGWATPPLRGRVELEFQQIKTKMINIRWEEARIRHVLELIPSMGRVKVERSAGSTCANIDFHLTFLTKPGRQNILKVTESFLSPGTAKAEIIRYVEGHLLMEPIWGDHFYTMHDVPQVQMYINNVPAECKGDCSFEWLDESTPILSSLDPSHGLDGTPLRIFGDKFSEIPGNNIVKIGSYPCVVTESSMEEINCTVGEGAGTDLPISVNVARMGFAAGTLTFSYSWEVTGIMPESGSFGGGLELSVTGQGFPENAKVYVDSQICTTAYRSFSTIHCIVPASTVSYDLGNRTVDVSVQVTTASGLQALLSPNPFNYMVDQTGVIMAADYPTTLNIQGGDQITFNGTNFGTDPVLKIGATTIQPTSLTENEDNTTTVTFVTPPNLTQGSSLYCLYTDGNGCAVFEFSVSPPTVDVIVSSVSPLQGSVYGGTIMTFEGFGFGTNKDIVDVRVGGYRCIPIEVLNEKITCQIERTYYVENVTNMGDGEFGPYFSWNPHYIDIYTGDTVRWQWDTPEFIESNIAVHQIETLDKFQELENGIKSGAPGPSGIFEATFTVPGEYNFWSGYVDEANIIYFQCTVNVAYRESYTDVITVKVSSQEARYIINSGAGSGTARRRRASIQDPCQPVTPEMLGSPVPEINITDPSKFNFIFSGEIVPTITGIDYAPPHPDYDRGITTFTEVMFNGTGFPSDACVIEVQFHAENDVCGCELSDISLDEDTGDVTFMCLPEMSCAQQVGVLKEIQVFLNNIGYALIQVPHYKRFVAFLPTITSISPSTGSAAGGTDVTIGGAGFREANHIKFGTTDAICEAIDDTTIKCISPTAENGLIEIKKDNFPAVCELNNGLECEFTYDSSLTPIITMVSPSHIDTIDPVTITITGENLGNDAASIQVLVGGEDCSDVSFVSDVEINCALTGIPAGNNQVEVTITGVGKAQPVKMVYGTPVLNLPTPDSGSIHGGAFIEITGHGFHKDGTTVTIDGSPCNLKEGEEVTLSHLVCETPAHVEGLAEVLVTVGTGESVISFPVVNFNYTSTATPFVDVNSVAPAKGIEGEVLTVQGSSFGTDFTKVRVEVGGVECSVSPKGFTETALTCILGVHARGPVEGFVYVEGLGRSNSFPFTYQMSVSSVDPNSGDVKGDQVVTVHGIGFLTDEVTVTICGKGCRLVADQLTPTELVCVTPPGQEGPCPVMVADTTAEHTLSNAYTYVASVAPRITSVAPSRGGTGGGVLITVTGSGFGTDPAVVKVTLDPDFDNTNAAVVKPTLHGITCDLQSVSDVEIQCVTNAISHSGEAKVAVTVGRRRGVEVNSGDATFLCIDLWSSVYTWGGETIPKEAEIVVIQERQVILLDTDTPILKLLLIKGGRMVFDDTKDIHLNAENILITHGGELQVGSENKPYTKKAEITLHGHLRSKELPVFGAKVLGLREGKLELHGKRIPKTWTLLSATANAGDTQIRVPFADVTNWDVGSKIVIATSGHFLSQIENEEHKIVNIIQDGDEAVIALEQPLAYKHTGEDEEYIAPDGTVRVVPFRAEVGLLSRNIVFRGSDDAQWHDPIPGCPVEPMDTDETTTQTCFQGRYGEEFGSDQFGAQIMIHPPEESNGAVIAHIEYVEMTYVGQAFRLGRYPIHFHLAGDVSGSYVRGCAIHRSFNRAVNSHGTDSVTIEQNVVYNIMGGAFFLEDGIESRNEFEHNLAVFVKRSSSNANDDNTPAAFWITNPNNIVRHNHAVGGTHSGFWYRINENPTGPSFNDSICLRSIPLGEFFNNTAHSNGFMGLWTFEIYIPQQNGNCKRSIHTASVAKFRRLTAWNNKIGGEFVTGGALQLDSAALVQSDEANFRGKQALYVPKMSEDTFYGLENSLIVGHTLSDSLRQPRHGYNGVTKQGVVVAFGDGVAIRYTKFFNFDEQGTSALFWTEIRGVCHEHCGGYPLRIVGLSFDNVIKRGMFRWMHEAIVEDTDNSLECRPGEVSAKILPDLPILPPNVCVSCAHFSSEKIPAIGCPSSMRFHNWAFNVTSPTSLRGKDVLITGQYGDVTGPYQTKRVRDFKPGFQVTLLDGETYIIEFIGGELIQNISLRAQFSDFSEIDDCMIFGLRAQRKPDRFSFNAGQTLIPESENGTIACPSANHGDWIFDDTGNESYVFFAIAAKDPNGYRRSVSGYEDDIYIALTMYKCWWDSCIPPPPEDEIPPSVARVDGGRYCDMIEWYPDPNNPDGFISMINDTQDSAATIPPERRKRDASAVSSIPEGSDITVAKGDWIVLRTKNCLPNRIRTLLLLGILEVSDLESDSAEAPYDYTFTVNFIIIRGGRLIIGWPDKPFEGTATIILAGSIDSPYYENENFRSGVVGAKAIAAFGGLDLHGKKYEQTWTTLTETVNPGATTLKVFNNVSDWPVGGSIIVTTTSYTASQTEERKIAQIVGINTIVIDRPLSYKHIASKETVSDQEYGLAAAVGLLSRNIKIKANAEESEKVLGGRVLVSVVQDISAKTYFTGYARLSFVEFINMGQEGFTDPYDARYGITWYATNVREAKPSSLEGCSFNTAYSTAIGVYGSAGLKLYNNVVYNTVGKAVVLASSGVQLIQNLISNVRSTASYNGRYENFQGRYEAGVEASGATSLTMLGNYVTGSERAAYHVPPASYVDAKSYNDASANLAVASLIGWAIFPRDSVAHKGVNYIYGYKFWKIIDYAVYYNSENSVEIRSVVIIDCGVGVFPMVVGPSAVAHKCEHKTVKFADSVVIGYSSSMNCAKDVFPKGNYMTLSSHCRGVKGLGGERFGVLFPQFTQSSNQAPISTETCSGITAYMSLCGSMTVTGVTFKNFGLIDNCPASFAIATNPYNDDLQHPVTTSNIQTINVQTNFEVMIQRPRVEKINLAACVDMDCDGLKKALLEDTDGTFLGVPGSIISDSAFEYNGDPRRGFGDYRIPKEMQTYLNGTRIPVENVRDHIGIARTENCQYIHHTYPDGKDYGFYKCPGAKYQMFTIENLDADTETRRLSPVAVRASIDGVSYVDLLNGAQDHGWCSGYHCARRLSTFFAIVPDIPGTQVDIFLTGSPPNQMRFFFITPSSETCTLISFYYPNPNRIDVYANSGIERIYSTNARMLSDGRFVYENDPDRNYIPTCNDGTGANYIDREEGMVYFILKGSDMIVLARAKVVVVSFMLPEMTVEEFFGDAIIRNIAALLNVPLTKVRIVKAIRAYGGRRGKRETSTGMTVQVEIGDDPPPTADEESTDPQYDIADTVMTACQDTTIVSALGAGSVTCETVTVEETVYVPTVPESLQFILELEPQHEGVFFGVQPVLRAFDSAGNMIHDLGIKENPWKVTATLRNGTGHPNAVLSGTTTITSVGGWFNFTDLKISHAGQGYIVDFEITYPASAAELHLNASSATFDIEAVPMTMGLYAMTSDDIIEDTEFSVTFELIDKTTGQTIEDITWRGHTFDVDCGLPNYTDINKVFGNLSKTFNSVSGRAQFDDLVLSGYGLNFLECHVVSTPAEFDFYFYQKIFVLGAHQVGIQRDTSDVIVIRFKDDFATVLPTDSDKAHLEQMVLQDVVKRHPYILLIDSDLTEGSILVTFTVEGPAGNVSALKQDLCDSINEGQSYTLGSTTLTLDHYMAVDGQDNYGVLCGVSDSDDDGLHPGYIVLIVVASVLLLLLVLLLVIWKLHIIPKAKTREFYKISNNYFRNEPGTQKLAVAPLTAKSTPDNGKAVFLGGANGNVFRESTLESMKGDGSPPLNTLYSSSVKLDLRRTPTPSGSLKSFFSRQTVSPAPLLPNKNERLTPTGL